MCASLEATNACLCPYGGENCLRNFFYKDGRHMTILQSREWLIVFRMQQG